MRVLWITNIPFPPICEKMGWHTPAIGGWMYSAAKRIKAQEDIQLFVAFPSSRSAQFVSEAVDGIHFFAIPYGRHNPTKNYIFVQDYWKQIHSMVNPDVVHIHGTEYAHGNDYIRACGADHVVVSVQGLLSACSQFYYAGIEARDARYCVTLRDIIRKTTMLDESRNFARRGEIEKDTLRRVHHVIGRTNWDKTQIWALNPDAVYHYCGEALRDPFYRNAWNYEHCEPHSIFLSQAGYALKGLHMVIKALPLVMAHYPDTKVYVAGDDITKRKPLHRYTSYGRYIRKMLRGFGVADRVVFTGPLDEYQMCERYLRSNVFICPSSLENSPNSLGEAQALGVPAIASYVGGVPDMMRGDEGHLYRFEDSTMLAKMICVIFEEKEGARPCQDLRSAAIIRHDPESVINTLLQVYRELA